MGGREWGHRVHTSCHEQVLGSNIERGDYQSVSSVQFSSVQFSSVQLLSRVRLFATPWITAHQASCPSPAPRVHSDSHPSSRWCHPAISSSVVPFSSCPQSLAASESFPVSQLFAWGGQSTGVSALASFLVNTKPDTWDLLRGQILMFCTHIHKIAMWSDEVP